MSVTTTLAQVKALLQAITVPDTPTVYAYPDDGVNWRAALADAELPVIFVREAVTRPAAVGRSAFGRGEDRYEIELILAVRALRNAPADLRAGELLVRGWRRAFADVLYADQSLGGNVSIVGNITDGSNGRLFEAYTGIVVPDDGDTAKPYYGMAAYIGVRENYTQTMG